MRGMSKETTKRKRPEVTTVQVRKSTQRRLVAYREAQMPRPSMADLVTVAIELYLDAHEAGGEEAQR